MILDNYGNHTHANVQVWLDKHPRFHLHFTPTSSSWLNLVVRHEVACDEWRSLKGDRLMSVT